VGRTWADGCKKYRGDQENRKKTHETRQFKVSPKASAGADLEPVPKHRDTFGVPRAS
jgi:hypothetical protein